MPLTNGAPVTIKDLDDLDEHVTTVVGRTRQELINELHNTKQEVEKLRIELHELKQQIPPRLKTL
jgi:hypothetical protein